MSLIYIVCDYVTIIVMCENLPRLSRVELDQLGQPFGSSEFVNLEEWQQLRAELVLKSVESNPKLTDMSLTAYTPGETSCLLDRPDVQDWQNEFSQFVVPPEYDTVVLVPCAKTKPWDASSSRRSSLYRSYHKLIQMSEEGSVPPLYFVTISEPLGIVPQDRWSDFLQYDNPGLFRDDYLRTGMVKSDWIEKFGARKHLPFDEERYRQCVMKLGSVVGGFIRNNSDRRILSFVDTAAGQSTHQEFLDVAVQSNPEVSVQRHLKRGTPRVEPIDYMVSKINGL